MAQQKEASFLTHHDLRVGWVVNVPRNRTDSLATTVREAIVRSHVERAYVPIEGTALQLTVFLKNEVDGNAGVWVASNEPMANGKIPANAQLYSATIASIEATAPLAWRCIVNQYINHMLDTDSKRYFHAPSLMPRTFPWLCGFVEASAASLSREECQTVLRVVRIAGLDLLARCERAMTHAAQKGQSLIPNPDQYIELRKWD